jgi:hypothetical protein
LGRRMKVVVGRRMKESNLIRGQVRALAKWTRAILGKFSYETTATVASVALETEISKKSVRDWCFDLAGSDDPQRKMATPPKPYVAHDSAAGDDGGILGRILSAKTK